MERKRTRNSRRKIKINNNSLNDSSGEEFPILKSLGLYASEIRGDGNCQFRAFSDQLYGDHGARHAHIRGNVVKYMEENAAYFRQFLGGLGYGEDSDIEEYIQRMAEDGVYGDNGTIVAFARQYNKDVVIFQSDFMYVVRWQEFSKGQDSSEDDVHNRVYIAYHTWEHYSSVRNMDGPHDGMPNVQPNESENVGRKVTSDSGALWKVGIIRNSLSYPITDDKIMEKLSMHDGNIENTVEDLIMCENDDQEHDKSDNDSKPPTSLKSPPLPEKSNSNKTKSAMKPKRIRAREKKEKQKRDAMERKKAKLNQKQHKQQSNDDNQESMAFRTMYV